MSIEQTIRPLDRWPTRGWGLVSLPETSHPFISVTEGEGYGARMTTAAGRTIFATLFGRHEDTEDRQVPRHVNDAPPPAGPFVFTAHPGITADGVVPHVHGRDRSAEMTKQMIPDNCGAVQRWRFTYQDRDNQGLLLVLVATVFTLSPIVYYEGYVTAWGDQTDKSWYRGFQVVIPGASEVLEVEGLDHRYDHPPGLAEQGQVYVPPAVGRQIRFTAFFPTGGFPASDECAAEIYSCRERGGNMLVATPERAPLFGELADYRTSAQYAGLDHYDAEVDANQTGSHRNYGVNALATQIAVTRSPRGADALARTVGRYMRRPNFLIDPKVPRTLSIDTALDLELEFGDGRLRDGHEKLGYVALPGQTEGRTGFRPHDEQHCRHHSLFLAFALTGSLMAREVLTLLRIIESRSVRVAKGWRNPAPRGDANWLLFLGRAILAVGDPGGYALQAVNARLRTIESDQLSFMPQNPGKPYAFHTDDRIAPHEYAWLAHACLWLARNLEGVGVDVELAKRIAGRASATAVQCLYADGDEWKVPYTVRPEPVEWLDGDVLSAKDDYLRDHPGSDEQKRQGMALSSGRAWVYWLRPGVRSFLDLHPDTHPLWHRASAALSWMDRLVPPSLVEANFCVDAEPEE